LHNGKSRGKLNTRKVCKTRKFYEIREGNFAKVGGKEKFPEIGGNELKQRVIHHNFQIPPIFIGGKFGSCGE